MQDVLITGPRKRQPKILAFVDKGKCFGRGCEMCIHVCPVKDCIYLVPDPEPGAMGEVCEINVDTCIGCQLCSQVLSSGLRRRPHVSLTTKRHATRGGRGEKFRVSHLQQEGRRGARQIDVEPRRRLGPTSSGRFCAGVPAPAYCPRSRHQAVEDARFV